MLSESIEMYHERMTRVSSRAIIFLDQKVLLIRRKRDGLEYWVTPGGKVEEGETFEETVKREVQEEIGIDVEVGEKVLEMTNHVYGEDNEQHFFLCEHRSGKIGTGTDQRMSNHDPLDVSEVVLVGAEEVDNLNIVPLEVKNVIADAIRIQSEVS